MSRTCRRRTPSLTCWLAAEAGDSTRDPHLGKVVFSVLRVNFTPLPYCSVHPASTPSAASALVVERSTIGTDHDVS